MRQQLVVYDLYLTPDQVYNQDRSLQDTEDILRGVAGDATREVYPSALYFLEESELVNGHIRYRYFYNLPPVAL